jgi:Ser/Thr protein kinase RdoA (MazF antagonist)
MHADNKIWPQQDKDLLDWVLAHYPLGSTEFCIIPYGQGLINRTWKVTENNTQRKYILQKINTSVFKTPQAIADNIAAIGVYLSSHAPDYYFVHPLAAINGACIVHHADYGWFRLMPFVENAITYDTVETPELAYEAALAFGKFSATIHHFPANKLQTTLPNFHNLIFRYYQYQQALQQSGKDLQALAAKEIDEIANYYNIVSTYEKIVADAKIPLRIMHHDTKISNCLFDESGKTICVIDLDTMMPGYFISDVGDMCRSYLSPENEESTDYHNIGIRMPFYKALAEGYLAAMGRVLTQNELEVFTYAGKFLIYMQALRYLSDFLNGNIYYPVNHPLHNLDRTRNQLALLKAYCDREPEMQDLIRKLTRL